MPVTRVFANLAGSTLAGAITQTSTTLNVASGTGTLFPTLAIGQFFDLTLTDALTGLRHEIVRVTVKSVDAFTIIRGQNGTLAQAWIAGDLTQNLWTAGAAAGMTQDSQLSSMSGGISAMQIWPGNPNNHLAGVAAAGTMPPDTCYDTVNKIIYVCNRTGTIAGAGWVPLDYARLSGLSSQTFDTAPATLNTQAVNLGQFKGFNQFLQSSGYQIFPGGLILQWMVVNVPQGSITPTLPIAFPTNVLGVMASYQASLPPAGFSVGIGPFSLSQVLVTNLAPSTNACNIFAIGY